MASVEPLPLGSPRWNRLGTRMGPEGAFVRDALQTLLSAPNNLPVFTEMWPEICSEETTYDAAYAAAPYLVMLAEASPEAATEYLTILGFIENFAGTVPADLDPAYRQALKDAIPLTVAQLATCPLDETLRYLLGALATFRGRNDLGRVLNDIDLVQEDCPKCGHLVFPSELTAITEHDHRERRRR